MIRSTFDDTPIVGGRNNCRGLGLSKRPDKAKKEVNPKILWRCMVILNSSGNAAQIWGAHQPRVYSQSMVLTLNVTTK